MGKTIVMRNDAQVQAGSQLEQDKRGCALRTNTSHNIQDAYILYIFRLLFAILRPVRLRYNLCINPLLALNSCYLYSKLEKKEFYTADIIKFNRYFSPQKMKTYIRVLTQRGMIESNDPTAFRVLYHITPLGIEVIESIQEHYTRELAGFCRLYGIEL